MSASAGDVVKSWQAQITHRALAYIEAALLLGDGLQVVLYVDSDGNVGAPEIRSKARIAKPAR